MLCVNRYSQFPLFDQLHYQLKLHKHRTVSPSMSDFHAYYNQNWLEQMFDQVSVNLYNLLDKLTFIYNSHGVQYVIQHYFETLMRLLAPIQLFPQYNIKHINVNRNLNTIALQHQQQLAKINNQVKSQNKSSKKNLGRKLGRNLNENAKTTSKQSKQKSLKNSSNNDKNSNVEMKNQIIIDQSQVSNEHNQQITERRQKVIKKPLKKDNSMTLNNNKNTNIKSENADISNKAQNMTGTQNQRQTGNEIIDKRVQKRRPSNKTYSLNQSQQRIICKWIANQVRIGIIPSKKDIQNQAKAISKSNSFQARPGWYRRFLYRHPSTNELLQNQRRSAHEQFDSSQYIHKENNQTQNENHFKMQMQNEQRVISKKKEITDTYIGKQHIKPQSLKPKSIYIQLNESQQFQEIKPPDRIQSEKMSESQQSDQRDEQARPKRLTNNLNEEIELQYVVNRLENAVKGHKSAVLFSKGPFDRISDKK